MIRQIKLHHAALRIIVGNEEIGAVLLTGLLNVFREIHPALGFVENVVLQRNGKKNCGMNGESRHEGHAQGYPCSPAPFWMLQDELPPKRHQQDDACDQGWSDPVGLNSAVQAEQQVQGLDGNKLTQEMLDPRLVALDSPKPDCGDHHADQKQWCDRTYLAYEMMEDFTRMDGQGMIETAALVQCLDMEPARLDIPPKHRQRTDRKPQKHCQALAAAEQMPVRPRPAEEHHNGNQLDRVDELCQESHADGRSQQEPVANLSCRETQPGQIGAPGPKEHTQGINRHQNGSDAEQWDAGCHTQTPECSAVVIQSLGQPEQLKRCAGAEQDREKADTKNRVSKEFCAQRNGPGDQGTLIAIGKGKVL